MSNRSLRFAVVFTCSLAAAAGCADAAVCLAVDDAHDTLSPRDRAAALLLLAREFESAGEPVVASPCPRPYVVSHIQLGDTILVTVSGPAGRREARALGLDDLPAIYNQMVRSIVAGQSMDREGVVDRANVSNVQAAHLRVHSDTIVYARLGYGVMFGAGGAPSVGLIGYRHELDAFAIDVSALNFQFGSSNAYDSYGGGTGGASSASWLKLEGLYFRNPVANRTAYFGGGLSVGGAWFYDLTRSWNGTGLQGELTAGYELARASTIRLFVQADAGLPFYTLTSTSYTRSGASTSHRYAPSLTVSMGLGWQRDTHRRR